MKKLILSLVLSVFAFVGMAQNYGVIYTMDAPTSKSQFLIPKNNQVFVTSTKYSYQVLRDIPGGKLMSTVIADPTWVYPVGGSLATASISALAATAANISSLTVPSLLNVTGRITQYPTRGGTEYWYATSIDDDGDGTAFTAQTPAKTYMNYISVRRVSGMAMTGDSRDVLYKATYSNYASNDASSQFQGIGISGRNRSGGVYATMNAGEFGINNSGGGILTNAYGGTFTVENYGSLVTNMIGVKIDLRNEGAIATNEYGLYITNTNNSLGTAVDAAVKIADAGTNIGWYAGIDMAGATVSRAIIFPTAAAADTTAKTAGAMIYLANVFYGCNGTFWYKMINP
jgi:hypothetical protein